MSNIVHSSFISCACNRYPHALDWNYDLNVIAFASSSNVGIIVPEDVSNEFPHIASTNSSHNGDVTSVSWIKGLCQGGSCHCDMLLSSSLDCSSFLWAYQDSSCSLNRTVEFTGHTSSVSFAVGCCTGKQFTIVTLSTDSTLKIWRTHKDGNNKREIQTFSFGNGFVLAADFTLLGFGELCLVTGHEDNKIRLYCEQSDEFQLLQVISGHENWVRDISICFYGNNSERQILLASCSQDKHIRVYRIKSLSTTNSDSTEELRLHGRTFQVNARNYEVLLETILSGHEGWIYGVKWHCEAFGKQLQLMSASIDKSVILWEQDYESGIWIEKVRVGDVGGNLPGFYGCVYNATGTTILSYNYYGALYMWRYDKDNCSWKRVIAPTGHFGSVEGICWSKGGEYLLSCSHDQTSRLFGPWKRENGKVTYHEMARPQVHGYDLQSIASVSRSCFVSGAEEKIVRAFVAPRNFLCIFKELAGFESETLVNKGDIILDSGGVPSLGLSNVGVMTENVKDNSLTSPTSAADATSLTEDNLLQNTLWPEVHKLYGHGFEVFVVASNPSGTIVASACKASSLEHAAIILWSVQDWRLLCRLTAHSLTVTQLTFSYDGRLLLSVSRDRTWALFEQLDAASCEWKKVAQCDKKSGAMHSRIIWDAAWGPDSNFITVSRDKKAIMWKVLLGTGGSFESVNHLCVFEHEESITAVDIAAVKQCDRYLIAFGTESGSILIYSWSSDKGFVELSRLNKSLAHSGTVKRLKFRPCCGRLGFNGDSDQTEWIQLASCGADHSVKIYDMRLECLRSEIERN